MRLKSSLLGVAALAAVAMPGSSACAQLMDQLKGAVGSGQGTGGAMGGAMGGLTEGLPSVTQASPSNTAGVLQYCVRNKLVSGSAASSVKDSMVSKVTGSGQGANDSGFKAGNNGLLQTGNGQSFSLSGSGVKEQVTQKVCGMVLDHAKSLL
nr:DUF2501 domain-containing protein [uncultured Rhodopila sp.]